MGSTCSKRQDCVASPTALVTSAPVRSEPGFTSSTCGGQATMMVLTMSDSLCWLRHACSGVHTIAHNALNKTAIYSLVCCGRRLLKACEAPKALWPA